MLATNQKYKRSIQKINRLNSSNWSELREGSTLRHWLSTKAQKFCSGTRRAPTSSPRNNFSKRNWYKIIMGADIRLWKIIQCPRTTVRRKYWTKSCWNCRISGTSSAAPFRIISPPLSRVWVAFRTRSTRATISVNEKRSGWTAESTLRSTLLDVTKRHPSCIRVICTRRMAQCRGRTVAALSFCSQGTSRVRKLLNYTIVPSLPSVLFFEKQTGRLP